jgi:GT2 family glycosyltransferase
VTNRVSVIICTYNRAPLLRRALGALARQTTGPEDFEIVVVDDGSQDLTAQHCAELLPELPNLRVIRSERNLGLPHARNLGIDLAIGDYLLFTDDDCIVAKNWVECLRDTLERAPIVAGAVASTRTNAFRLCHNIAQFHAFMPGLPAGYTDFIAGASMGFRRSVLVELGKFKEGCKAADDTELILRARSQGYRPYFVPEAVAWHEPQRTTLAQIVQYSALHASVTIALRNQYRVLLRTPWVLRSPWLLLITAPLIALKVTAGIYLANRNLIKTWWTAPMVYALKLAWCWGAFRGLRQLRAAAEKCDQWIRTEA